MISHILISIGTPNIKKHKSRNFICFRAKKNNTLVPYHFPFHNHKRKKKGSTRVANEHSSEAFTKLLQYLYSNNY